jgi:hypothetical protein
MSFFTSLARKGRTHLAGRKTMRDNTMPASTFARSGIVPFLVGWVSGAQPTGRKALLSGG